MTVKKQAALAAILVPLAATLALSGCSAVSNTAEPAATADAFAAKKYTTKEVAKHKTTTNCWIIINKKVYNFSRYKHEGGSLKRYCGKDGTSVFKKEHKGADLRDANSVLPGKYIGWV